MSTIPVIDIQAWREGDLGLARTVDRALQESGFLLVENHGVSSVLTAQIRACARRFFLLPPQVKVRYAATVGGRGWVPPGREANAFYGEVADATRSDLKESYTIGRDFATGDEYVDGEWFRPNVWPGEVPELAGLCCRYTDALRELYDDLLALCAVALGLGRDWFIRRTRLSPHTFNINRYPAMSETGPALPGQFRIAPHTDWGVVTILDRQVGYGGLQIQRPDGVWEDAPHHQGAFTVNIGDLMARWTGDRWRSTRHRVLPPSASAPDEELISLILFLEADTQAVIEPLAPPIGRGRPYAPVTAGAYLLERANAATVR